MAGISGVAGAGPLWRQTMLLTHQGRSAALPPWPPNMERRPICSLSGGLPASEGGCPIIEEIFEKSTAPKNVCPLHQTKMKAATKPAAPKEPDAQLELLVPAPGAVYALDPDVPPEMQVLALQADFPHKTKGAAWRVNGTPLAPSDNHLEARLKLTPGQHVVELAAWGDWGRAQTRAHFTVLGKPQNPTKRYVFIP